VLRRGPAGRPASPRTGLLVEFDQTDAIFTQPADRRTEDYITGGFGERLSGILCLLPNRWEDG